MTFFDKLNDCFQQSLYHKVSVGFPSAFAKQNGWPDIGPAKRGTVMIAFAIIVAYFLLFS